MEDRQEVQGQGALVVKESRDEWNNQQEKLTKAVAGSDKEMNVRDNKYKYDNQDSVANGEMKNHFENDRYL